MGTNAAYYCIWNRGFTQNELKEKLEVISTSGKEKDKSFFNSLSALLSPEIAGQLRAGAAESTAHFSAIFGGKSQTQGNRGIIAYSPDAKWLPLFETTLCEGYTASSKDTAWLSKLFAAPVLAFSIFDSDVLFVSYSDAKKGICYDYVKPNFEEFKEYDTEQYSTEFPNFLSEFCNKSELEAIWDNTDVIFADNRLEKLCRLMQIDLLFDGTCVLEGFQLIT